METQPIHGAASGRKPPPRGLLVLALLAVLLLLGCGNDDGHHGGPAPQAATEDRGADSVERIRTSALHAVHAQAKEPVACEGCHELLAGQYLQAASWRCQKCHAPQHLELHAAASIDSGARACWSCHDFKSTSKQPTPCLSCHDKPSMTLPAITVHDPKHADEDCGACHRAHQEPTRLVSTPCEGCHKQPVSGHTKPGIQITGCGSCHGYHEPAATASTRCTNCHRQSHQLVSFNATFPGGHVKCTTCHRPHRFFKSEVIGCRDECHLTQVALSENKVEKHRGCIGCHDNHDVKNSPQTACLRCHKIVPKHPLDKVSSTPCIGCHAPHKGAGTPIAAPCSSCHKIAASDHAFHQGAAAQGPVCRDCHRPHDFAKKGVLPSFCLGCHGEQPFKNAKTITPYVKHNDCFRCHGTTVAHAPAGKRVACVSCHTEKAAIIRKDHANCVQCHDPHTTKQRRPCGACHKAEADKAYKDHQICINCHDPHSGLQKKPCGGCHSAEAASAPKDHQTCMNCHDQHSTLQKRPCKDCHADRATGVHAAVKGGCINCHRPHGPGGHATVPACMSCHDKTKLPGMHQVPQHQECTTCHRSHGEQPNRLRATCIGCHKDRSSHEPTAKMCFGCHPFRGGAP